MTARSPPSTRVSPCSGSLAKMWAKRTRCTIWDCSPPRRATWPRRSVGSARAFVIGWHDWAFTQMIATDVANLGEAHHFSGSLDEAERLYREALTCFETLGDPRGQGFVLGQLGLLALDRGNPQEGCELLRASLKLRWRAGLRGPAADTLEALAEASWRLGDRSRGNGPARGRAGTRRDRPGPPASRPAALPTGRPSGGGWDADQRVGRRRRIRRNADGCATVGGAADMRAADAGSFVLS